MIEQLGGRKFIYAILAVIISSIFVVIGKLTALQWTTFVSVIGGIYVVGNVITEKK